MSFVLVTGTLATISTELDWVANSASRVYRLSETKNYDWVSLYVNAQGAYPDAELLSISASADPWFAVVVVAADENRERFRIFLDPETNEVQGEGRWYNWQRFFRQTHRHLMLPIKVGVTIVGLLSVPLFIAFCSGTVIYQKWWRRFFVNPLSNAKSCSSDDRSINSARRLWGNIHRWLAVWSLWFILLIASTGIWYLVEQQGLQVNYAPIETADTEAPERDDSTLDPAALSDMTSQAARLYPELDITNILLPYGDDRLVRVQGQSRAILVRDRANQIAFDTRTGKHVNTRKGIDLSTPYANIRSCRSVALWLLRRRCNSVYMVPVWHCVKHAFNHRRVFVWPPYRTLAWRHAINPATGMGIRLARHGVSEMA